MKALIIVRDTPLYFVRLPDDERQITKVMVATFEARRHGCLVRGAWDPDDWDTWSQHEMFTRPVDLACTVVRTPRGMILEMAVLVPLRDMPRAHWPEQYRRLEAWRGDADIPRDAHAPLPLGILWRRAKDFRFGGHIVLESRDVMYAAIRG